MLLFFSIKFITKI